MFSGVTNHVQLWAANWVLRRQGNDPQAFRLKRRRIYVLPTRFGVMFGLIVLAMLFGSLNYGASLGFALTFLLAGLALVVMHHCHNNLLATEIRFSGAQLVFAGGLAEFRISLSNDAIVPRYELDLKQAQHDFGPIDLDPGATKILTITVSAEQRGWLSLQRFAVATRHPGNLFRAWTWVHMNARCLVYPEPAPAGRPLPANSGGLGTRATPDQGDSDFAGLKTAAPGDPPGRMAWKAYARSGELLSKQFASSDQEPCILDWDSLPDLDTEARLSQLTRWCLDALAEFRSFGIRLPNATVAMGSGERHLHDCLKALALFEASA